MYEMGGLGVVTYIRHTLPLAIRPFLIVIGLFTAVLPVAANFLCAGRAGFAVWRESVEGPRLQIGGIQDVLSQLPLLCLYHPHVGTEISGGQHSLLWKRVNIRRSVPEQEECEGVDAKPDIL